VRRKTVVVMEDSLAFSCNPRHAADVGMKTTAFFVYIPFTMTWPQIEEGQDVAEYAVILAVVVLLVVPIVRLIGSSSTNIFSAVGSSITQ